jgi:hypothetical protein
MSPVAAPSNRPLLLFNQAHMTEVRASLRRGEPQFQSALTALRNDADSAVSTPPMSVMDKAVTPPSGDKHDYMSQAPYWWPDPSKPNGRPYILKDGQRNPEIDRITDRQELARLSSVTSTLALAFFFTGQENYAQQAAKLLRTWFLDPATRMNPNLNFGQGIPGITEGRAAGIVETRFLPTIVDTTTLLQGSSAWTAADDQGVVQWMQTYLVWLLTSPLGEAEAVRANNQETWYDLQLIALAMHTGQKNLATTHLEEARDDIAHEFRPDGGQPRELERTRAWDYSIFDLTAFTHIADIGKIAGVDLWNFQTKDGRSLRRGIDFLVPFATGKKRWPYKQITEFRPKALHPVLRRAAVGLNDPKYRTIAEQIGGGSPRLQLTVP